MLVLPCTSRSSNVRGRSLKTAIFRRTASASSVLRFETRNLGDSCSRNKRNLAANMARFFLVTSQTSATGVTCSESRHTINPRINNIRLHPSFRPDSRSQAAGSTQEALGKTRKPTMADKTAPKEKNTESSVNRYCLFSGRFSVRPCCKPIVPRMQYAMTCPKTECHRWA